MIAGTAAGAIAIRSGPSIGCGETRSEIAGTAAGPVATYSGSGTGCGETRSAIAGTAVDLKPPTLHLALAVKRLH